MTGDPTEGALGAMKNVRCNACARRRTMTKDNKDNKLYIHVPADIPSKMPGDYTAEVATLKTQTTLYSHQYLVTIGSALFWQTQSRSQNPDQMTPSGCIFQNRPKANTVGIGVPH
jgi:hypothetical protein